MAVAASLTDLQAQASCHLCLDYLRDPVTIDCGHNFCGSCLQQCWEDLQDIFPCPVCLHHCPNGNFMRNTQLGHMAELVKQLDPRRSKRKHQEEKVLCEEHNQGLTLFCEKHLELLCAQCGVSSGQRDHQLMPLEQAAATHRKKLKSSLESLKKIIEAAEKGQEIQLLKSHELKWKLQKWRRELISEFEQLKSLLGKEQEVKFIKLLSERTDVEDKLTANKGQLSKHIYSLKYLLREITEKHVQADLALLTGIESIYNKHENLRNPEVFSYGLQKNSLSLSAQYFGLLKMMSIFKEDLSLDPETAHPNLIISDDRKTAILGMKKQKCLHKFKAFASYPAVWSCEGFDAGRHFWQVEVIGTGELAFGVCEESFPRHALISRSTIHGCWKVHLWSRIYGMSGSNIHRRIGIFLDYELGEVSLYNLNDRTHIYTFTSEFTEKIVPFFSVEPNAKYLKIRIVLDE